MANWFQNMFMRILRINPSSNTKEYTIKEGLPHDANVLKNSVWYRGDASELEQFFKQAAVDEPSRSKFWAAVPTNGTIVRKIHSGLPSLIADVLSDIVIADMNEITFDEEGTTDLWKLIEEENKFEKLIGEAVSETIVKGDGAFKISLDTEISQYPILEFFGADRVKYKSARGRLQEILYYTEYFAGQKSYILEEAYGVGYINYKLYDKNKEVPLNTIPETALLKDTTFQGKFIWGIPLMFYKSPKWAGRGRSLFDAKDGSFDALDEVISQWWDAIRSGRVQKYIPEDMIPRDWNSGTMLPPNSFDNQYIKIGAGLSEDGAGKIEVVQPEIKYQAFVESYASAIDMSLQGIISPSTLGIDLKKTDNAESQREKEKATLYTRNKIVNALNEIVPALVSMIMKVNDLTTSESHGEYEPSVGFGDYASPSFDVVIETVGKARSYEIMSLEQAIEEMYGDTWTDEQKAEEIERIRKEKTENMPKDPNEDFDPNDDDPNADDPNDKEDNPNAEDDK